MSTVVNPEQGVHQDRFMAVAFTQPWPDQSDMPDWHQHLTIFPWARGDIAATAQALERIAPVIKPISSLVIEKADFGTKEPLPVWLLGPIPVLRGLHNVCLAYLTGLARIEDPTFVGEKYTPHITYHQSDPQFDVGDSLAIGAISLIQKVGDRRVIAKTIELGDA
jgi:hypothetical protein